MGAAIRRPALSGLMALPLGSVLAATVDPALVPSMFSPESTPAHSIDQLSRFVLLVTGLIFVIVFGLIIYTAFRFRVRAGDDGSEPAQIYGSNPVEVAWTTVPMLIVVVLALVTARVIHDVQAAPKPASALDIELIGHQWWWEVRYPKFGFVTANELHVPVSSTGKRRPSFIALRSADVAHSFWVPRLAGKTDLIPNHPNETWIEPMRTGLFVGQCAEYCGTQHAKMMLRVVVHTEEDFAGWVSAQQAGVIPVAAVAAGREVFARTACVNCHTLGGTNGDGRFGPDLTHLMSRETLGAGALKNSRENLRAWIKNPDQFKPGVNMPAMNVDDAQLDQLVDFLASLK